MRSLRFFFRNLLLHVPREILLALLRLIIFVPLFPLVLLLRVWESLRRAIRTKNLYPEEERHPCSRIPEAVMRRPEPCIYSQFLLQAKGLPVTWNNPDIWVARADNPGAIEPDSYHLVEGTDYIVSVRVHNASTDLALGVRVRLNHRKWSFNRPSWNPVETDAKGKEVFRLMNGMPMSSNPTQFYWRTPTLKPGDEVRHFCLQARLFHPMDTNASNNVG